MATRFAAPPPSWDRRNSVGRVAHRPGRGGASSPSSSPGKGRRRRSEACRAPRPWEGEGEAWLGTNANAHPVRTPTRCSCPTQSTTTTSREWWAPRTRRKRQRTPSPNRRARRNYEGHSRSNEVPRIQSFRTRQEKPQEEKLPLSLKPGLWVFYLLPWETRGTKDTQ